MILLILALELASVEAHINNVVSYEQYKNLDTEKLKAEREIRLFEKTIQETQSTYLSIQSSLTKVLVSKRKFI
jgi:hypothetical protein